MHFVRTLPFVLGVLVLALSIASPPGFAQTPQPAGQVAKDDAPASGSPASGAQNPAQAELQALKNILANPDAVAQLRDQIDAVLEGKADPPITTGAAPDPAAVSSGVPPDVATAWREARPAAEKMVGSVETYLWGRVDAIERTFKRIWTSVLTLPELLTWAEVSLDELGEWRQLLDTVTPIAGLLLLGLGVMLLISRLMRPLRYMLAAKEDTRFVAKLIRIILLTIIRAVPILLFAVAINAVILLISPDFRTKLAFASAVTAVISVQVMMLLVRAVFAPAAPNSRLIDISDHAAREATRAFSIVLSIAAYGNTLILVLGLYGMPFQLVGTFQNILGLFVLIFLIVLILGNRRPVAEAIAGLDGKHGTRHWSEIPWRPIARLWHIAAILFVSALFVIYTVQGEKAFLSIFGTALLSFFVLAALVWFLQYVEANEGRLGGRIETFDEDEDDEDELTGSAAAAEKEVSLVLVLLRLSVGILAALTFLEVWGLSTWGWLFGGETRLSQAILRIVAILSVIYLIWVVLSNIIASNIRRLQARASSERSTNRTQTVLVLARNGIFFALCVVAVLSVLPQLGVNIGPLLAGAGVLGVAIGFGSQRLVQDIISGLFNLIEDNFAVGDVVDLSGKSGVVEAVTIRTVRLRDLGGNVHTIPFSAVDVVTNMTKDFSYAVFEIGIAYREKVDDVVGVIEEIGQSLRRERAYRRVILEPLEMFGLDSLGDSSVNIKCRIKVRPGSQWKISREFNRRLKNRFDELGIEIPFPHQTVYFGTDRDGTAPAANVRVENETKLIGSADVPHLVTAKS